MKRVAAFFGTALRCPEKSNNWKVQVIVSNKLLARHHHECEEVVMNVLAESFRLIIDC